MVSEDRNGRYQVVQQRDGTQTRRFHHPLRPRSQWRYPSPNRQQGCPHPIDLDVPMVQPSLHPRTTFRALGKHYLVSMGAGSSQGDHTGRRCWGSAWSRPLRRRTPKPPKRCGGDARIPPLGHRRHDQTRRSLHTPRRLPNLPKRPARHLGARGCSPKYVEWIQVLSKRDYAVQARVR